MIMTEIIMNAKELKKRYDAGERDFRKVKLSGAFMGGLDLVEVNLREAEMTEVNLSDANLKGANLREANLTGAVRFVLA